MRVMNLTVGALFGIPRGTQSAAATRSSHSASSGGPNKSRMPVHDVVFNRVAVEHRSRAAARFSSASRRALIAGARWSTCFWFWWVLLWLERASDGAVCRSAYDAL